MTLSLSAALEMIRDLTNTKYAKSRAFGKFSDVRLFFVNQYADTLVIESSFTGKIHAAN